MKKWYIEFESIKNDKPYSLQSRYFDTIEDAMAWYKDSFDYIDTDEFIVALMYAKLGKYGIIEDIYFEEFITHKYR